jgi:hypothetical protein
MVDNYIEGTAPQALEYTQATGASFSMIYSRTHGFPYTFNTNDGVTHCVMSVPYKDGSPIQTITYTREGVSTLILHNPITGATDARNSYGIDQDELKDLLLLIENSFTE